MVLPNKHLPLDRSLLYLGGEILRILSARPRSVSSAWENLRAEDQRTSFEQFTLATSLLFALGAVDFEEGNLRRNVA
jgi:ABC-three component (ABC-3C) system Middle Component 6